MEVGGGEVEVCDEVAATLVAESLIEDWSEARGYLAVARGFGGGVGRP